ncbi:MAG: hypothetical protein HZY76_05860 [Anaerolineae bacterium]|nr:MAG: hypothetical protein HZY76_05860 [Anaerolineae bacterium]
MPVHTVGMRGHAGCFDGGGQVGIANLTNDGEIGRLAVSTTATFQRPTCGALGLSTTRQRPSSPVGAETYGGSAVAADHTATRTPLCGSPLASVTNPRNPVELHEVVPVIMPDTWYCQRVDNVRDWVTTRAENGSPREPYAPA